MLGYVRLVLAFIDGELYAIEVAEYIVRNI
jgi:hypothetical protein